jgi:hypothetical protein
MHPGYKPELEIGISEFNNILLKKLILKIVILVLTD